MHIIDQGRTAETNFNLPDLTTSQIGVLVGFSNGICGNNKEFNGIPVFFQCATMLIVKVEVQVNNIQNSEIKMLNIYIGSIEFLSYDRIYIESL